MNPLDLIHKLENDKGLLIIKLSECLSVLNELDASKEFIDSINETINNVIN